VVPAPLPPFPSAEPQGEPLASAVAHLVLIPAIYSFYSAIPAQKIPAPVVRAFRAAQAKNMEAVGASDHHPLFGSGWSLNPAQNPTTGTARLLHVRWQTGTLVGKKGIVA